MSMFCAQPLLVFADVQHRMQTVDSAKLGLAGFFVARDKAIDGGGMWGCNWQIVSLWQDSSIGDTGRLRPIPRC